MVLLLCTHFNSHAQDVRYSQFFAAPLKLNPAMMGANTDLKAILNYRTQWGVIGDGFNTARLTILYPLHMKEDKGKLDIGLSFISDKAGAYSSTDVSLALSYNILLSSTGHNLSAAMSTGFVQKKLGIIDLEFDEQYQLGMFDPNNPNGESILNENVSYPDFGGGILWYYNPSGDDSKLNAYAGASIFHVNTPNESLTDATGELPIRYSYQAGFKIIGSSKIDFSPNVRFVTQEGAQEMATGIYMDYNLNENTKLVLGTWFKRNDAIAIILGIDLKKFSIGYSYDLGNSELNKVLTGVNTHEVTLMFRLDMAEKKGVNINPSPFSNY